MTARKKRGKIIIPYKRPVDPEEYTVAEILTETGHDVTFLPETSLHRPDILYRSIEWEIKSPKGKSSRRTIQNNLRTALAQSSNIIINLERIKLPEENCINTIKNQFKRTKKIKRMMIVTKDKKLIVL